MLDRFWVWSLLTGPAAVLLALFAADVISYGQALHQTGQCSVALLIVALSVTPLRRVFGTSAWLGFILRHRRAIGVASFAYAAGHTGIYLERKWGAGLIAREGQEPWLATGWLALLIFLMLAATSNTLSVRLLRERWKTLHRLVYLAAALSFAHWILAAFDPLSAYVFLGLILFIEALRFSSAISNRLSGP